MVIDIIHGLHLCHCPYKGICVTAHIRAFDLPGAGRGGGGGSLDGSGVLSLQTQVGHSENVT